MTGSGLADGLATVLDVSGAAVLTYFVLINSSYLLLLLLATLEFVRHTRRHDIAGYDDALASPLTLPVSVLLPAHDEQAGIVESVQAMLGLRYAELEVEVVDDGRARPARNGRPGGLGLIGMRERAALHGGELQAGPRPGGGFAVRARLPTPEGAL